MFDDSYHRDLGKWVDVFHELEQARGHLTSMQFRFPGERGKRLGGKLDALFAALAALEQDCFEDAMKQWRTHQPEQPK